MKFIDFPLELLYIDLFIILSAAYVSMTGHILDGSQITSFQPISDNTCLI